MARLYLADLRNGRVRAYRGGTTGPLERSRGRVVDGPTPTGTDIGADRIIYGWANLATCLRGGDSSSGIERASEIWQQGAHTRKRLAHKCQAYGVFGPFLTGPSTARWLTQVPGATTLSPSPPTVLPPRVYGAAQTPDGLISARGTETGPVQVVLTPTT